MNSNLLPIVLSFVGLAGDPVEYPPAPRGDVIDVYHGVEVPDPYRWLEDPESEETRALVAAQNALARQVFDANPNRATIERRLRELWPVDQYGTPAFGGDRVVYAVEDGVREHERLMTRRRDGGEPAVLLDPDDLGSDGYESIATWSLSPDGSLLAYAIAKNGTDWWEWRVRDVETGTDLEDRIPRCRYVTATFSPDASRFVYARYPDAAPGEDPNARIGWPWLYLHKIGDASKDDRPLFENAKAPHLYLDGTVSSDGRYVVVFEFDSTRNQNDVWLVPIGDDPDDPPIWLLQSRGYQYRYVGDEDGRFYFWTNDRAPRWRVIGVDPAQPEREHWSDAIAQQELSLAGARFAAGRLVGSYLKDASSEARMFGPNGDTLGVLDLPGIGTAYGFNAPIGDDAALYYGWSSFGSPASVLRVDLATNTTTVFLGDEGGGSTEDPPRCVTRRVFCRSRDGTRVPLFITRRADLADEGPARTFLWGYGGFYTSQTPGFSVPMQYALDQGYTYALACTRGGGEYGLSWHEGGMGANKENVFDDFVACAEWMIENDVTTSDRLAISGMSNGGLLVGACLTRRPDLFGAAVPKVGVFDMLRYPEFTVGHSWISEYGSPDDPRMFEILRSYSPLHQTRPGTKYPPTLILTGDHDDRVPPAHSYKFAAALQHAQSGDAPILLRVESRTGHGVGTPTSKRIAQWADTFAFLDQVLTR